MTKKAVWWNVCHVWFMWSLYWLSTDIVILSR